MSPEISIVIPVYCDQDGIQRCLEHISRQDEISMAALEVIVVDNASDPRITLPADLPFASRLIVEEKKGAYAARNAGAKVCSGLALAFLDADCWPDKRWIVNGLDALTKHPSGCIVGGDVLFSTSDKPSVIESYQVLMGFGQRRAVEQLGFAATANLFVESAVFTQVGFFDEGLLSGGDREWSWRAGKQGLPVLFSEKTIVWTAPRRTLKGALVQARRVAGGRQGLQTNPLLASSVGSERIKPEKGIIGKFRTILCASQFSFMRRLLILCTALTIRVVHDLEVVRLKFGGEPERR